MTKIDDNLHPSVLSAVAKSCGFSVAFDRRPNTDEWTLRAGHGASYVEYAGTRQSVCAFLAGYVTMRERTATMLNGLEDAHRGLITAARERLGDPTDTDTGV